MKEYYQLLITKREYKRKDGSIRISKSAKIIKKIYDEKSKKWKSKTLIRLGPVKSKEDEKRYRKEYEKFLLGNIDVSKINFKLKDINLITHRPIGIEVKIREIFKKYGIEKELRKILDNEDKKYSTYDILIANCISRFYCIRNEFQLYNFLKKQIDIGKDVLYDKIDKIIANKEKIEEIIYKKLKEKGIIRNNKLYYDITSCYVEGSYKESKLFFYGYSRDHRKDKKQLVIGILTIDNIPISSLIFEGNKLDKETIKDVIKKIKERYKVKKIIFVGDRGMNSRSNIKLIENNNYEYILGEKRRRVNKILREMYEKNVKELKINNKRYILVINEEERKKRLEEIDSIVEEINEIIDKYKEKDKILIEIGKKRLKRYIEIDKSEIKINKKAIEWERTIAGKYILVTNCKEDVNRIIENYKDLKDVEYFFKELKHEIYIRPLHHHKDNRIKGHIFLCVLSLLFKRLIMKVYALNNNLSYEKDYDKIISYFKSLKDIYEYNLNIKGININYVNKNDLKLLNNKD